MRLSLLISLSLLLLSWRTARAQLLPADVFFNSGAQFYISNNIPSALERVESGLKIYPDDEKLKKLEKLLKQQQQSQQNQQKQSQQQQKSRQNSNGQKNQQSSQKNSENQAEQKNQTEEHKPSAQKETSEKQGQQEPLIPGQMTPEEAKRLLDAQKDGEQFLALKPQGSRTNASQPFKDW